MRELTLFIKFKDFTLATYDDNGYYTQGGGIEEVFLEKLKEPEDILKYLDEMVGMYSGSVLAGNTDDVVFVDLLQKKIYYVNIYDITNKHILHDLLYKNPRKENIFWQHKDGRTIYKIPNSYFDEIFKNRLCNQDKQ